MFCWLELRGSGFFERFGSTTDSSFTTSGAHVFPFPTVQGMRVGVGGLCGKESGLGGAPCAAQNLASPSTTSAAYFSQSLWGRTRERKRERTCVWANCSEPCQFRCHCFLGFLCMRAGAFPTAATGAACSSQRSAPGGERLGSVPSSRYFLVLVSVRDHVLCLLCRWPWQFKRIDELAQQAEQVLAPGGGSSSSSSGQAKS